MAEGAPVTWGPGGSALPAPDGGRGARRARAGRRPALVLVHAALVRVGGLVAELLHRVLLHGLGLLVGRLGGELLDGVPGRRAVGRRAPVARLLGLADGRLDALRK